MRFVRVHGREPDSEVALEIAVDRCILRGRVGSTVCTRAATADDTQARTGRLEHWSATGGHSFEQAAASGTPAGAREGLGGQLRRARLVATADASSPTARKPSTTPSMSAADRF